MQNSNITVLKPFPVRGKVARARRIDIEQGSRKVSLVVCKGRRPVKSGTRDNATTNYSRAWEAFTLPSLVVSNILKDAHSEYSLVGSSTIDGAAVYQIKIVPRLPDHGYSVLAPREAMNVATDRKLD